MKKYVTPEKLADTLDLPISSVWRLAREGMVPFYRIGRLIRFDLDEVLESLAVTDKDKPSDN